MVKFIGEYEAKIDDKGRVVVPSAFKAIVLQEGNQEGIQEKNQEENQQQKEIKFVIKKDLYAPCLNMFTYEQWSEESEKMRGKLNLFRKEDAAWYREYMMDRALVCADLKVGRIIIPRQLLAKIGAEKELVFSGNDFKIEIWAKQKYGKERMDEQAFAALTEKLLG